jgi:hypothetical protein
MPAFSTYIGRRVVLERMQVTTSDGRPTRVSGPYVVDDYEGIDHSAGFTSEAFTLVPDRELSDEAGERLAVTVHPMTLLEVMDPEFFERIERASRQADDEEEQRQREDAEMEDSHALTKAQEAERDAQAIEAESPALERVFTISEGAIRDVLGGEVEEMKGDGIARYRFAVLLARDCARRKLMAVLLPAVTDEQARDLLRTLVTSWEDDATRKAGHEILDHAWIGGSDA